MMSKKQVKIENFQLDIFGDEKDDYFRNIRDQNIKDLQFLIKSFLPQGPYVYIDVGANIGLTSLYISKVYPQAQIYCFEPEKRTFEFLKKNVEINGCQNIKIFNVALGDSKGKLPFFESEYYPAA